MSQTIPTADSERVRIAHEAARAFEDRDELEPITNCDNCGRAFFTWAHDDDTPLVWTNDGILCETCAHDGTVEGAVCSDHPDIRLSDGCYKCDQDDYVLIGDRHYPVSAVPVSLHAAANGADICHNELGTAHLESTLELFVEELNTTEHPAAAWEGLLADPGYGPDHEDIADFVWRVADHATARLVYHGDIVDAYAGIAGWREEADIADDGLFLPEQTIEQRMLIVLFRVAERFLWQVIADLRQLAA